MSSRLLRLTLLALLSAIAIAACGGSATTTGQHTTNGGMTPQSATLMLDFTPNAIHTGIYLAVKRGYTQMQGVDLHILVPGQSTDAPSLLAAGRVDFAVLDIHDLAIADARGAKLVGLMALVERPLAAVIAQHRYQSPAALQGQTVGVTGDPSDLAVLRSEVAGAGGNPARVKTVTIGYNAVPDLVDGRVAAATSFWNDEGVQLQHDKPGDFNVFRVEKYGAPPYPELIVTTTRAYLNAHPAVARGLVHALVQGYQGVLQHPSAGAAALESSVSGLSAASVKQQLAAELPAFVPIGGGTPGTLSAPVLARWASWEQKFGIVKHKPDLATMFDNSYLPH